MGGDAVIPAQFDLAAAHRSLNISARVSGALWAERALFGRVDVLDWR
jgi:hypothetical protein